MGYTQKSAIITLPSFGGLLFVLFFASFFVLPVVHAQQALDITRQTAADLGLDEFSAPSVELIVSSSGTLGSTASLTAKTSNIDDNSVSFEWYLDDQPMLLQSGRAKTSFSFITTKPFHIVRLSIIEDGKKIAENAVSVTSFNVSLVWRTATFVPADYEGKPLPIVGSTVTVTAFPDLRGEAPEDLLYTWYIDAESRVRNVLAEQEFSFTLSKNVSSVSIIVEVSNLGQSVTASKAITIPLVKPQVILSSALPFLLVAGQQVDVQADPFYFHAANKNELSYEWSFFGITARGIPPDPFLATLRIPKEAIKETGALSVTVENLRAPGEKASKRVEMMIL